MKKILLILILSFVFISCSNNTLVYEDYNEYYGFEDKIVKENFRQFLKEKYNEDFIIANFRRIYFGSGASYSYNIRATKDKKKLKNNKNAYVRQYGYTATLVVEKNPNVKFNKDFYQNFTLRNTSDTFYQEYKAYSLVVEIFENLDEIKNVLDGFKKYGMKTSLEVEIPNNLRNEIIKNDFNISEELKAKLISESKLRCIYLKIFTNAMETDRENFLNQLVNLTNYAKKNLEFIDIKMFLRRPVYTTYRLNRMNPNYLYKVMLDKHLYISLSSGGGGYGGGYRDDDYKKEDFVNHYNRQMTEDFVNLYNERMKEWSDK